MIGAPVRQTNELGVVVEQQAREEDDRQSLLEEIAHGLRHDVLHLSDVVGPRKELSCGAPREEGRGLPDHVLVQAVPEVSDDALPDVRHQVVGELTLPGPSTGRNR
jgi:hypothetical protein